MKGKTRNVRIVSILLFVVLTASSFTELGNSETAPEETVLKIAGTGITSINHLEPMLNPSFGGQILNQVVEGLFELVYDENNKTVSAPWLATNYTRPNPSTWRLTLENNVTFHDGTEFNASSVAFHLERLSYVMYANYSQNPNLAAVLTVPAGLYQSTTIDGYDFSWMNPAGYYSYINSTSIIDEYTIDIITNFPVELDIILCWGPNYIVSPTSLNWDPTATVGNYELVGTGAYTVDDVDKLGGTATLLAFNEYWGGTPDIDRVEIVYFDTYDAIASALLNHEIDMAAPENPNEVENVPGINLHVGQVGGYQTTFNFVLANVPELSVRKAMAHAFNYQYYLDLFFSGYGVQGGGAISYTSSKYDPSINIANFNLTEARQFLIDDGIAPVEAETWDDTDWALKAESDPLMVLDVPYTVWFDDAALILAQAGRDLGIQVNLTLLSPAAYDGVLWVPSERAKWDVVFSGFTMEFPNEQFYFLIYDSSFGFYNLPGTNSPEYDNLVIQMYTETDPDEKTALMHNATDMLQNDIVPRIWISQARRFLAYWDGWYGVEETEENHVYIQYRYFTNIDSSNDNNVISGYTTFSFAIFAIVSMISISVIKKRKINQ